jgi:heterodisulfide reductase subunit A2
VIQKALVIGGGVAGMQAALGLADQGFETVLVEKSGRLGGNAWHLATTSQGEPVRPMLEDLIARVNGHERIEVSHRRPDHIGKRHCGQFFTSEVAVGDRTISVQYGAAVLATGAKGVRSRRIFIWRRHPGADPPAARRSDGIRSGKNPVGPKRRVYPVRRLPGRPAALLQPALLHPFGSSAIDLKTRNPDMNVYILYRDMRTYGLNEDLYTRARAMGVIFIRYDLETNRR